MKSYSNFIVERKKGNTAVASPAPGDRDPLDPSNRKRIDKKFSNPSNPPKVANPEAPKTPKTPVVKQADVSKQAAKYRRAQRVKGATGGKTTGSLSKGNLSFPGDRSGATAKAKSDIAARRGFSGSKSGGLKADEANPNVDRSVRQQRTVKQGIPDPFKSKTPAPARPFKGISKKTKTGSPSIPDPFKSATTKPKTAPKPKAPSGPGPATSQAIKDIRSSMSRRGVQTTETDVVQRYMRKAQDAGRSVDPDLVGAQGVKASGAKPEMVGGSTAPKGTYAKYRAQADATRDISKQRGADLDKAIKNLTNTGSVTKTKPSGPSSSIGFKQFSMKADKVTQKTKAAAARSAAAGYSQSNKPKPGSTPVVYNPKIDPLEPYYRTTGGSDQPKVINRSTNKPEFKNTGSFGYRPEYKPKSGSTPVPSKPGDITLAGPSKGKPSFPKNPKGSALAKNKSFSQFSVDSGRGRGGALTKVDDVINVDVKDITPKKTTPKLSGGAAAVKAQNKSTRAILKSIGKGTSRALGVGATGVDAFLNYRKYRNQGDSRLKSGLKSAFRASVGWLGGAAGSALGSVAGPVGTIGGGVAGYSAGTWLADKVLGTTKKKRETAKK